MNQFLLETFINGRRHSRLHLDKVSNVLNETLIFSDFLNTISINLSWRRDEILARGKNRVKRIGENNGVRRFSLFYSSPGAGFAPRNVRRKINI